MSSNPDNPKKSVNIDNYDWRNAGVLGQKHVWILFGVEQGSFPNFYPIKISFNQFNLRRLAKLLPPEQEYQLFKLRLDKFLAQEIFDKSFEKLIKVESQLGKFHHEHFASQHSNSEEIEIE